MAKRGSRNRRAHWSAQQEKTVRQQQHDAKMRKHEAEVRASRPQEDLEATDATQYRILVYSSISTSWRFVASGDRHSVRAFMDGLRKGRETGEYLKRVGAEYHLVSSQGSTSIKYKIDPPYTYASDAELERWKAQAKAESRPWWMFWA